ATIYNAKNHRSMINLWTVEDRVHKFFLPAEASESITAAAFSPDGQFIAAGLQDGSVDVWRLADQRRGFKLKGQPGKILKVVFSEDSRSITVGSTKAVWVWDLLERTFYRVAAQNFPLDSVSDIAFPPQGNHLALAAGDGTVWLMNVASGEVTSRLETADGFPLAMAFSQDGDKLAIGSENGSLQIWDIEFRNGDNPDINYLKTLLHPDQVKMVAFSPTGSTLASITLDGKLRLWNYTAESILDTYPDNAWESVNTFAISSDGKTLASSSWTGPTHLFKDINRIEQPRFFDRAQSDQLSLPLAFPPDPSSRNWQSPARSLYEANDILEAELKVPTYLPPGFVFGGARVVRLNDAAWLQYFYQEGPGDVPKGTLTIFQGPQAAEISDMPLGASAVFENVQVALSTNSEIVSGDWIPVGRSSEAGSTQAAMVTMIWDSQSPSYRLRFRMGSRTMSLYYEQIKDMTEPHPYVNPADMVAVAESLVNFDQTYKPKPVLWRYTVSDGDTCTTIAQRFGTTLGEIVRLNGLTNDCEFIFSGQEMTVPLNNERVTLAETDLNCDGTIERVRVIPDPASVDGTTALGIVVETPSRLGYYQEAWRHTIADTQAYLFSYPRILTTDSCQKELTATLWMNAVGESREEIYRWQGDTMLLISESESLNSPH
ncbi:MAG TPA: LysM peptidoglycan-binding domain-containing protein, partial [Anaerolineales bacterium]